MTPPDPGATGGRAAEVDGALPDHGRVVAVDLGSVRIGVAASDATRLLASPRTTLRRSGDRRQDHAALAALVAEEEATVVVVGLPLSLDGGEGRAARLVLDELDALRTALPVPVVTHDERFTTTTAHQQLGAAGTRARDRREVVDRAAAAVLLQGWLDSRRYRAPAPTPNASPEERP